MYGRTSAFSDRYAVALIRCERQLCGNPEFDRSGRLFDDRGISIGAFIRGEAQGNPHTSPSARLVIDTRAADNPLAL